MALSLAGHRVVLICFCRRKTSAKARRSEGLSNPEDIILTSQFKIDARVLLHGNGCPHAIALALHAAKWSFPCKRI